MAKKIGGVIVSDFNHTNYGSALQAYATIKTVQEFGYDLYIIRYQKTRSLIQKLIIIPKYMISGGYMRFIRGLRTKYNIKHIPEYESNQRRRRQATNAFKEKEFVPLFREYIGYHALCDGSKEYDAVFVGSDQTWHPIGFYSNYWNLNFVADSIPKFSYASSYGVSKVPIIQKTGTKRYLERIDLISVREKKAQEIVESLTNKKAQVVADPTMLRTSKQWLDFASNSDKRIEEPYIFCYFLGPRRDIREEALKLAKKTGCKIIINPHMEEYRKADEGIGDYIFYDLNPYDFVKLLSEATFVCTDSFHGTVFSILTHRKFMTFYREFGQSTNSRIDNLLSIFGLTERLYKGNINNIFSSIDYDIIDCKLADYREESLSFFKRACSLADKKHNE